MNKLFLPYLATGLIYLIPGAAMITGGVFQLEYRNNVFLGGIIRSYSSLVIAAGALYVLLGLYGIVCSFLPESCATSKKETIFMVLGLMMMIVALILSVAAFMTTYKEEITQTMEQVVGSMTDAYPGDEKNDRLVDSMQQAFQCCGTFGPYSWQSAQTWKKHANTNDVPDSCCIDRRDGCGHGVLLNQQTAVIFTAECAKTMIAAAQPLRTASALFLISAILSILVGLSVIPCLWNSADRRLPRTEDE